MDEKKLKTRLTPGVDEDHNLIQRIASAVHSILHRLEAKPVQVPEAA